MTRRIIQQLCRHTRHWSLPILNGRWRVCFRCGAQQRYFKET